METDHPDDGEHGARRDAVGRAREDLYAAGRGLDDQAQHKDRDRRTLSELLSVVQQMNAELDIERVLSVAARQIIEIFEAERVFLIDVKPEGELRFRLALDFKGRVVVRPEQEVSHAVIRDVLCEAAPVLVLDATGDTRFAEVSSVRLLHLHWVMAAPLIARGDVLGVVYADNRLFSGVFDQHTLDLLGIFANHVAVALRNARLFHELDATRSELAQSERLRTIGEVATFVAHQVKNPLGSIKILLDSLRERWEDTELRDKVLDIVPREVSGLNKAVEQMLNYARPTPLVKVPVSLVKLLQSALQTLAPEIGELRIEVATQFAPDMPDVLADGERVREVFINLVRNSLEAMSQQPSRSLRLSAHRLDETQEEVIVEDTGAGIPEAQLAEIFEPFRTNKESGSGIGLALCQKVIREHGGHISAENVPTGGARFRVTFPIRGA